MTRPRPGEPLTAAEQIENVLRQADWMVTRVKRGERVTRKEALLLPEELSEVMRLIKPIIRGLEIERDQWRSLVITPLGAEALLCELVRVRREATMAQIQVNELLETAAECLPTDVEAVRVALSRLYQLNMRPCDIDCFSEVENTAVKLLLAALSPSADDSTWVPRVSAELDAKLSRLTPQGTPQDQETT